MGTVEQVIVRAERPGDRAALRAVNTEAFGRVTEADIVDALRERASPLISLVAETDGAVVGHVMFSPVSLQGHRGGEKLMGLAPMAVAPPHQRKGIGSALVRAGLARCSELGVAAVFVLGHPAYYPRFGFTPAARFGISSEFEAPAEAFMAVELQPGRLRAGTVEFDAAFRTPPEQR